MISRLLLFFTVVLLVWGCNNIDNASPSKNNTFIKFFHDAYSVSGVEVEVLPDGYALLGNIQVADDSVATVVIRTDKQGIQVGTTSYFPGTSAKSFEVLYSGDQVSGYLILGDSIKIDPDASRVGDIEIYSTRLLKVDVNGNIMDRFNYSDTSQDTTRVKIDYKGNSLVINDLDPPQIIVLGSFREDLGRPEKSFVAALNLNLVPQWYKEYDLLDAGQVDYNYVNARSVHYRNTFIVWASAILKPTQGFNDSYLAVPFIKEGSVFNNFSRFGETSSQLFLARDIQPASTASFGYGVIGTRGQTDGSGANMFFVRVDATGSFVPGSERYFDGSLSKTNVSVAVTESETQDQGEALTATSDGGFVLAGSTQSGNSARNIYLVKVNAAGDVLWNRIIGGEGDEVVSSIREESDGSIVISGTNNLSGLSSVFLVKVNKNGELKD